MLPVVNGFQFTVSPCVSKDKNWYHSKFQLFLAAFGQLLYICGLITVLESVAKLKLGTVEILSDTNFFILRDPGSNRAKSLVYSTV